MGCDPRAGVVIVLVGIRLETGEQFLVSLDDDLTGGTVATRTAADRSLRWSPPVRLNLDQEASR